MLRWSQSRFVRNVVAVATGTAAAQAIGMLLSPVITRLYGPDAFGTLGVFVSTVNLFAPAVALTLPLAIVLPKNDQEALSLVRLSIYTSLFMVGLVVALITLFQGDILSLLQIEMLAPTIFLVPLAALFSSWHQIAQQWAIRHGHFRRISGVSILHALAHNGGQVALGFVTPVASALIYVNTFARLLHALLLIPLTKYSSTNNSSVRGDTRSPPLTHPFRLLQKYRDFPLYRAPQVLLSAASEGIPVLLIASFYGPAVAGFYTLCRTVMGLPTQLIGASVGDVFYPRVVEAAAKRENLPRLIIRTTMILAVVGLLPYALVVAVGPTLFGVVFGDEWVTAGAFARWIALWQYLMLTSRPAIQSLPVLSAQRFHLVFSAFSIALRIGVLLLSFYAFSDPVTVIALFGITGMLINIMLVVLVIRIARKFVTPWRTTNS